MRYINPPLLLGLIFELTAFILFKRFPEWGILAAVFMIVGIPALCLGGAFIVLMYIAEHRQ